MIEDVEEKKIIKLFRDKGCHCCHMENLSDTGSPDIWGSTQEEIAFKIEVKILKGFSPDKTLAQMCDIKPAQVNWTYKYMQKPGIKKLVWLFIEEKSGVCYYLVPGSHHMGEVFRTVPFKLYANWIVSKTYAGFVETILTGVYTGD